MERAASAATLGSEVVPMADEKPSELSERVGRATVVFEHSMEHVGDALWRRLRRRPYIGVGVTGVAALALASLAGVGELAFACFAAYGMFKILRQHEPPSQAFREAAQLGNNLGLRR
jgi:hypothetical protein